MRKKVGQKAVFNKGIIVYNTLPQEIKQSENVGPFRNRVGTWLKNMNFEVADASCYT